MSGLKALRNRIKSVKSTQKITKAMQMVAAAKLHKAKEMVEYSRQFSKKVDNAIAAVKNQTELDTQDIVIQSMLAPNKAEFKKTIALVISSERGLCGNFNSSLWRKARSELPLYHNLKIITLGRKLFEHLKSQDNIILNLSNKGDAAELAINIIDKVKEEVKLEPDCRVVIYFMEYINTLVQIPQVKQIWPLMDLADIEGDNNSLVEIEGANILEQLLEIYVKTNIALTTLESRVSEEAARTSAMDSATRNAGEMIDKLTLKMNRNRQAQITTELIEVIAGAEAV